MCLCVWAPLLFLWLFHLFHLLFLLFCEPRLFLIPYSPSEQESKRANLRIFDVISISEQLAKIICWDVKGRRCDEGRGESSSVAASTHRPSAFCRITVAMNCVCVSMCVYIYSRGYTTCPSTLCKRIQRGSCNGNFGWAAYIQGVPCVLC